MAQLLLKILGGGGYAANISQLGELKCTNGNTSTWDFSKNNFTFEMDVLFKSFKTNPKYNSSMNLVQQASMSTLMWSGSQYSTQSLFHVSIAVHQDSSGNTLYPIYDLDHLVFNCELSKAGLWVQQTNDYLRTNQWYHLVVQRYKNRFEIMVNGISYDFINLNKDQNINLSVYSDSSLGFRPFQYSNDRDEMCDALVKEFRVSSIARYPKTNDDILKVY